MPDPLKLQRLLEDKLGPVRRSSGRNGLELLTTCPKCGHEYKLSVNVRMGIWHCWHCGEGGLLRKLIWEAKNIDFTSASPVEERKKIIPGDPGELVSLKALPDDHQAILYLKRRGFDPNELSTCFGVSYCREGKPFAGGLFNTSNTIVIPLYENGIVVGWQSRLLYTPDSLSPEECEAMGYKKKENGKYRRPPKYFTAPGVEKGRILFNVDWAVHSDTVVVTEGAFDAMAVGLCGIATFGKNVTDEQVKLLSRWRLVVLLLDPDAKDEQEKLARRFPNDTLVVPVSLSGYKDAGECPRPEIWRQIDETVSSNKYISNNGLSLSSFNPLIELKNKNGKGT